MTLRELREKHAWSQRKAAAILGIPERTYRRYEQDENYGSEYKQKMFFILENSREINEEKGC